MRKLDDVDVQFIRETYELPEWTALSIAEKLECTQQTVSKHARKMGLKRPKRSRGEHISSSLQDWEYLYYAIMSGLPYQDAASVCVMTRAQANSAMLKMLHMTEAERIIKWNLYRVRNGMPLFTKC